MRTLLLPRGSVSRFSQVVLRATRTVFELFARRGATYEHRDRVMATYAPVALLTLLVAWLVAIAGGFAAVLWAVEPEGAARALEMSGSSLLTLGFTKPDRGIAVLVSFAEAGVGLILVALLIAYLPTIYSTFSRREAMVTQYAVRAATPPTGWDLLRRAHLSGFLFDLDPYFAEWERWFVELQETHTSLGVVGFLRSPDGARSWVTTAGAVLDGASLRMSVLDAPRSAQTGVCIRAGYLALDAIAAVYDLSSPQAVAPGDPITIDRSEFDAVVAELRDAGVPLVPDLDAAWRDFAGWRVNYDAVLLRLASLFMAPYAPWSSDRSPPLTASRRGSGRQPRPRHGGVRNRRSP